MFDADDLSELMAPVYLYDADAIGEWLIRHVRTPREGASLIFMLAASTGVIVRRVGGPPPTPDSFYAVETPEGADLPGRLTGSLLGAAVNADDDMLNDLARAAARHPDEAVTAAVIARLIRVLSDAMHALIDTADDAAPDGEP